MGVLQWNGQQSNVVVVVVVEAWYAHSTLHNELKLKTKYINLPCWIRYEAVNWFYNRIAYIKCSACSNTNEIAFHMLVDVYQQQFFMVLHRINDNKRTRTKKKTVMAFPVKIDIVSSSTIVSHETKWKNSDGKNLQNKYVLKPPATKKNNNCNRTRFVCIVPGQ